MRTSRNCAGVTSGVWANAAPQKMRARLARTAGASFLRFWLDTAAGDAALGQQFDGAADRDADDAGLLVHPAVGVHRTVLGGAHLLHVPPGRRLQARRWRLLAGREWRGLLERHRPGGEVTVQPDQPHYDEQ